MALLTATVVVALVLMLPLYVLNPELLPLEAAPLALAYISVFASVFGFLFWNGGVAVVGPNTAGLFIHLMPVFGVALSVVLLGEEIAPYHLIGASLVFLGIAGASLHQTDTPLTKQEANYDCPPESVRSSAAGRGSELRAFHAARAFAYPFPPLLSGLPLAFACRCRSSRRFAIA